MKDVVTEATELSIMLIAILALLGLARFLASNGAFDPLDISSQSLGPVLLATTPHREATPGLHAEMSRLAELAGARGVEETRSVLGDSPTEITRGELVGVYHAPVRPLLRGPAELGVVLDAGEQRATEEARVDWQQRLDAAGEEAVTVSLVHLPDVLCVSVRHVGRSSELVAQWRVYRKLRKLWNKAEGKKGELNVVLEAISKRRGRVLVALPIDCTKPVFVS